MDTTEKAQRVLDLQAEYTGFESGELILEGLGLTPDRTRAEIAAEYAEALRDLLG